MARVAFLLLVTIAVVTAEVVKIVDCDGVVNDKCAVTEVRVNPCTNPESCRIKKGKDMSISFDYTPQFSASKLKAEAEFQGTNWDGVDADACKYTSCPTVAGQSQQYTHNVHIGKKLPSGTFQFSWKLFDEQDKKNLCCFKLTVQLKR